MPTKRKHAELPPQRLLTVEAAGQYISLGPWRIRTLIWSHQLPCVRLGRRILVDIKDLDALIERCKQTA